MASQPPDPFTSPSQYPQPPAHPLGAPTKTPPALRRLPPGASVAPRQPADMIADQLSSRTARDAPTTLILTPPPPPTRRRGFQLWPRTLRWRLILTYSVLLALLLLTLGVALNVTISRTLYRTDFGVFQGEATTGVAAYMPRFGSLVEGITAQACAGSVGYQQAFQDAIANPFKAVNGVSGIYLLDDQGGLLAPDVAGVTLGAPAPYLDQHKLAALATQAFGGGLRATAGRRILAATGYTLNAGSSQPTGVELMAITYRTASTCVSKFATAPGFVEVVTNFARVRVALAALRVALLVVVFAIFAVGLAIGGPLTARALQPLARVSFAARRVARGDLTQRVRLGHTDDEIGQLAYTFDEMVDRIQETFAAQQASEDRMRQFIADASHELRTPLTSIRGYTDVLLRGAKDDPETVEQVLLATKREAERMSRLVNDLLTLARFDTNRPLDLQPTDLIALAGEAVDQARILAGDREVALRTDGVGRLMVNLDADRIKQTLLVLLDNALKYGRQGPDGWVRVYVERTDRGALITIADNGQGIASDALPHIFERFYRVQRATRQRMTGAQVAARPEPPALTGAHAPQDAQDGIGGVGAHNLATPGGSGLGLAIAKAIVDAHGGSLTVQSRLGAGTTFTIALPINPPTRRSMTAPQPIPQA